MLKKRVPSNHQLDKKQKELLGNYCDQIIVHEESKSIHSLWFKTLKKLLDEQEITFEHLIFLNNDFFGPLFPIEIFWNKFLQSPADYYRYFSSEDRKSTRLNSSHNHGCT